MHRFAYWAHLVCFTATQITGDVLSHHIWGPRKKSWGIEMTLITSFMRGNGRHSSLVDIVSLFSPLFFAPFISSLQSTIRLLMSIGGLVPLPSDALVTPVTFRVRRRQLKGILADFDAAETGRRELSGEWVVGKKTWQRLQSEWKASQSSFADEKPPTRKKSERVILYLHGGNVPSAPGGPSLTRYRCILCLQCSSPEAHFHTTFEVR